MSKTVPSGKNQIFEYLAKDGPNRKIEGVVEAVSEAAAVDQISKMGYVPLRITLRNVAPNRAKLAKAPKSPSSRPGIKLSFSLGKERCLIAFTRHLSGFLKSGVPILRALSILQRQEKNAQFRRILSTIHDDIKDGKRMSAVLSRYPTWFSEIYVAMIRAGEESSTLESSLNVLATYLKKQSQTKKVIRQAMAYPMLLMIAGFSTVLFIISYVVPKLTVLFESMGKELPFITRVIIHCGSFTQTFWPIILLVIGFSVFVLPKRIKGRIGGAFWDSLKLKVPYLGPLIFRSDFARFSRTMQMTLTNGIPFVQALDTAGPTIKNTHLRSMIQKVRENVHKGSRIGECLSKHSIVPSYVSDMIAIGEESGNLVDVLGEIAETYEQDVDEGIRLMTTLLEPLMILLVGGIVGVIVLSMLLPIFDMDVI